MTQRDRPAIQTRCVHAPVPANVRGTPLSVPIYQTSVFAFDDLDEQVQALSDPRLGYSYSRFGNPTVRALEQAINALEGAVDSVAVASGMAAIAVALGAELRSGARVVSQRDLYGGTASLLTDLEQRWGVQVSYVDVADPTAVSAALKPGTSVLFLETISNPMTAVTDIGGLAELARAAGVRTVVDNTFSSPTGCRPLDWGADVVLHSTTKYLGGHDDLTGGVISYADAELHQAGAAYARLIGVTPDPHNAWLTLRGLKTLGVRMRQACANATELARRLSGHPAVAAVHHPSLSSHPQYDLAARLLDQPGAMLAFDLRGGRDAVAALVPRLRLVQLAASLGGVETTISHPVSSSHRGFTAESLAAARITPGTVRLSTGIEDVEDIWSDLESALDQ